MEPSTAPETTAKNPAISGRTGVGRKLFRIGIVLLLVSLSSFSLAFFHESLEINTKDLSRWAKPFLPDLKEQYVFLLLGTDAKIDINRTDTLILVFLDTKKMAIHTMSVLRDTYVEWLHKENRKINAVYAYAWFKDKDDRKAVEATRAAVEKLLSIRIDYYIKVDLGAFIRIIDLIGGVDVFVDKNMKYDDFSQNLHINLKKGHQHLDGEKAQQFVRFRRDADGDRARAQRQQRFMRAVVKQLTKPAVILRLPDIMRGALKEIVTNVEFDVALALANSFLDGGRPVVDTHVLPGEFDRIGELDYFVHDPRRTEELLKMFLEGSSETEFAATVEFITERAKIRHPVQRVPVVNLVHARKTMETDLSGALRSPEEVPRVEPSAVVETTEHVSDSKEKPVVTEPGVPSLLIEPQKQNTPVQDIKNPIIPPQPGESVPEVGKTVLTPQLVSVTTEPVVENDQPDETVPVIEDSTPVIEPSVVSGTLSVKIPQTVSDTVVVLDEKQLTPTEENAMLISVEPTEVDEDEDLELGPLPGDDDSE